MNWIHRHTLLLLGLAANVGVLLWALQTGADGYMIGLLIAWLAFGCCLCFNYIYNAAYKRKVRAASKLLGEGKVQEFIAQMEGLLKTAKGRTLRNFLKLYLAAAYIEAKQFDRANCIMEGLSDQSLRHSSLRFMHRYNLISSYYHSTQYEKAKALYDESQPLFDQYRNSAAFGASVAELDTLLQSCREISGSE